MEKRKQQGFTLIELMVTIAIVAILASIAVPAFKTMIINNRIEATANRLRNTFIQTRNKAIELGQEKTVTSTNISDATTTLVSVSISNSVSQIKYAADGAIAAKTIPKVGGASGETEEVTDLKQLVISICYDGTAEGIREKMIVVYPSGLASIKAPEQLISNENDDSNAGQVLDCT